MDKLVKKEVLTVYISQFAMILVSPVCCWIPIVSDTQKLTGWKAILGICVLLIIFALNVLYLTKKFYGLDSVLPSKYVLENMPEMLLKIEENYEKGLFSRENTDKCKNRYNTTLNWLGRFASFGLPLMIFDCVGIVLSVSSIIIFQIINHKILFSYLYGISGFFIVVQTTCLFISSRFLWYSVQAWIERLRTIG